MPWDEVGATGPAGSAEEAAITATLNELVGCTNATDTLRRLALFSDRSLAVSFGPGLPEDFAGAAAAPATPLATNQQIRLTSISDVQTLVDGRIVATVTVDDPAHHIHALYGHHDAMASVPRPPASSSCRAARNG